jgi:signal transduction histidine kinase
LFKPFSRADSALQFNYEGLGFSLFLDKIITDYMGGDILATSTKGSGTAITVKTALA